MTEKEHGTAVAGKISVYMHEFPNGKVYVGIANDPAQRWGGGHGYINNPEMYADIVAYGWNSVQHVILAECDTREQAEALEREYILLLGSENPEKGYNRTQIAEKLGAQLIAKRGVTFEGFGERRSAADWARLLGVHRSTMGRHLAKGQNVEAIFKLYGAERPGAQKAARLKKRRQSKNMDETRDTIHLLLWSSGYTEYELGDVEVEPGNNQKHIIGLPDGPFGVYDYKTGALRLSGKTGIPLKMPGLGAPMVCRNSVGLWEPHPQTVSELVKLKFGES